MTTEQFIPVDAAAITDTVLQRRAVRMNCHGSLFYFIRNALRRKNLTFDLHLPICLTLESEHIQHVIEMPRDHYKSTIASEGRPMWRALPFLQEDADTFFTYEYSKEFVRHMQKMHDVNVRMLLISENLTNSAKLGRRVRRHYESNAIFRYLFPEVLPDSSCIWTNTSLEQKRGGSTHGEATFDFLGVGGALQSRHYTGGITEDDLVGRKAIESPSIMDKTIDFHKLVIGAFEDEDAHYDGDELVVGNRWGFHDLNSHIFENEAVGPDGKSWFTFIRHSALGGCCDQHPPDTPIFPEKFSFEKLMKIKSRLGSYHFSCQFLNNPCAPEDADFKEADLNFYKPIQLLDGTYIIAHEAKDGIVRKDLALGHLQVAMAVDPAHSGNAARGRCRHAIVVCGTDGEGNYYLLEPWAQATSHVSFFDKVYEMAKKWKIRKIGFETIAGQKFAATHIEYRNKYEVWPVKIHDLKGEVEGPNGELTRNKEWRIRNIIAPIVESGRLFIQRKHQDFLGEFNTFPKGRYVDQLDALAYIPQLLRVSVSSAQSMALKSRNEQQMRLVRQPYTMTVH